MKVLAIVVMGDITTGGYDESVGHLVVPDDFDAEKALSEYQEYWIRVAPVGYLSMIDWLKQKYDFKEPGKDLLEIIKL